MAEVSGAARIGLAATALRDGETLARRLAEGDERAAGVLRERVARIVSFRGFRIPREDRLDIQQEVLAQIWEAVRRERFGFEGGFWGFVEIVAARRCIDWVRRHRPAVPLDAEQRDTGSDPLRDVLSRERVGLAHAALARLDPSCRRLIYLHAGLARPYQEIARVLGKSEGALRTQLHRCIKQARLALVELSGEPAKDLNT